MRKPGFVVSTCPTCGSAAIREVRGDWKGSYKGKPYTVKGLVYYTCPNCGERVYSPEAMRSIEEASPAYARITPHASRQAPNAPLE